MLVRICKFSCTFVRRNNFQISIPRYEPHYNLALLAENSGNFDLCLEYVHKSLELYPEHYASKELLNRVTKLYDTV